jgi:hypothetical protein
MVKIVSALAHQDASLVKTTSPGKDFDGKVPSTSSTKKMKELEEKPTI